jgi:hypothetical protein
MAVLLAAADEIFSASFVAFILNLLFRMASMENHLYVFTEAALQDMLDWLLDQRLRSHCAVPREDQPAGAMGERIPHMIIEEPVQILKHPEHGPD